ncbi:glycosyl transferase family 2 [Winogradskyella wandonensis]|uniref:Glycosyl transferase family 2 n=1 Tax=Winogradskyella wandonensis TaxID=1442586 RepID=A0A4R1KTL0_9FLAO|nr:glycosyltransferase family 2 protein [Winogradskyella wandonensis]TCK68525.1 glycosyl transferase family 2 [Winogradskyella wandonensis]
MKFYIIIPTHNEEDTIGLTLESLINQTLKPEKIVVVNDNSSDKTEAIIRDFANKYDFVKLVNNNSSNLHLPGTKIINAFYKGYDNLDDTYDVICKFDADLIFPENYLKQLAFHFNTNKKIGMAAGFCYIKKNNEWILEGLTNKDHIRGALKAYRKACFIDIGKLKTSIGWDTVDELLAKFYNWEIKLDDALKVKHLKPTGASYNKASKHLQGEAMYKMRYGLSLAVLTGLKMAWNKKSTIYFLDFVVGYLKARFNNTEFLVNKDQGKFIRQLRWKGIKDKIL